MTQRTWTKPLGLVDVLVEARHLRREITLLRRRIRDLTRQRDAWKDECLRWRNEASRRR